MMPRPTVRLAVFALLLTALAGCGEEEPGTTPGPDMEIERRVGYAVVVDETAVGLMIGFNEDRNATSGEAFDIAESVWRQGDGPWNEPPAACVRVGQHVELGVTPVQNAAQPGLLKDRVIWIACLAPPQE
jgi:hypothetical protein